MGVNIFLILFLMFFSSCEKEVAVPSKSDKNVIKVEFSNDFNQRSLTGKHPMLVPQNFNHQKTIYVPISYYVPVIDSTSSTYKLFIFPIWDQDYGFVQPTTITFFNCDSVKMDGEYLTIYPGVGSGIYHYTSDEGQNINFPYTDSTLVVFEYEEEMIGFIPNYRYENPLNSVPEIPVKGIYFIVTDYLNN